MEGYGFQTADEFLDPEEWKVVVNCVDLNNVVTERNKLISSVENYVASSKWDIKHFMLKVPQIVNKVTLKIKKTKLNISEVQIGQF